MLPLWVLNSKPIHRVVPTDPTVVFSVLAGQGRRYLNGIAEVVRACPPEE